MVINLKFFFRKICNEIKELKSAVADLHRLKFLCVLGNIDKKYRTIHPS